MARWRWPWARPGRLPDALARGISRRTRPGRRAVHDAGTRAGETRRSGEQLGEIVVGLGPGSYSGVRQAIAAATGLALATGRAAARAAFVGGADAGPWLLSGRRRRAARRVLLHRVQEAAMPGRPRAAARPAGVAGASGRTARRGPSCAVETVPPGLPPGDAGALPARGSCCSRPRRPCCRRWNRSTCARVTSPCPSPAREHRSHPTRCWAEIDLGAIRHNVAAVRAAVGPGVAILAVVKADAYGHGLAPVARALADTGEVAVFGVANVDRGRTPARGVARRRRHGALARAARRTRGGRADGTAAVGVEHRGGRGLRPARRGVGPRAVRASRSRWIPAWVGGRPAAGVAGVARGGRRVARVAAGGGGHASAFRRRGRGVQHGSTGPLRQLGNESPARRCTTRRKTARACSALRTTRATSCGRG